MSEKRTLTSAGPPRPTQRRLAGVAVLLVVLIVIYGCIAISVAMGREKPAVGLSRDLGNLGFVDSRSRLEGLPNVVRAGIDYPVRILVPPAAPGSELRFSLFDRGLSRISTQPPTIALCRDAVAPVSKVGRCNRTDGYATFPYAADGRRALLATIGA